MTATNTAGVARTNWAGNVVFHPNAFHSPTTLEELQHIVAASHAARVLGGGHSFSPVADTPGDMISLSAMPHILEIDDAARTVRVDASVRYGTLARELHRTGWALPNLGSLPHITVAGACATGTHGSGDRNGSLATAVASIELVTACGDVVVLDRERDPDVFPGAVVTLGTLGAVFALTLQIEPTFDVRQSVYDDVPWPGVLARLDELFAAGYSVSLFTSWARPVFDQVWVKQRIADIASGTSDSSPIVDWLAPRAATTSRHPVAGVDPIVCTDQLGVTGPWHERLPHFRLDFIPSTGDELQSEYFVDRRDAVAALKALEPMSDRIATVVQTCELRTIAADSLWLSMCCGRDSLAVHFTWVPDMSRVAPVLAEVESRLAPFGARPHWGKVFSIEPADVAALIPRLADAATLAAQFDPAGAFRNEFTDRYLRG